MRAVVYVRTANIIPRASIATSVRQASIDQKTSIGTKLMSASRAIVIYSIRPAIVKRALAAANAERNSKSHIVYRVHSIILVIQIVVHGKLARNASNAIQN